MRAPETFVVTRDSRGVVLGFYCAFDPSRFPARLLREDPVTRVWMEHLDREPVPRQQRAVFLRRLTAETGEAPSPCRYLQRHVGEAVPRIALLENVWEQSYDGGSTSWTL
jgi:hypothetical protein